MDIDKSIFSAFCQCRYKAFLKASKVVGEVAEYELLQRKTDDKFREEAIERMLRQNQGSRIIQQPPSLAVAVEEGHRLIFGAMAEGMGIALTYDILERQGDRQEGRQPVYVPLLFTHKNKLAWEESLLAALHGLVLAEALGQPVPFIKVVHGPSFSVTRIKLDGPTGPTRIATESRQILDRLRRQVESASVPPMILNSHCPSCEFRDRCRAEAVQKDDLSLLRGMSEK